MSTTPRTDAAIEKGYACPAAHSPLADTSRQLETELIALQEENKTFRAAQKACETCDTVVYDRAIKERDQLLATVEGLKQAGEMLWIVVANVSEGNWDKQSKEWQEAAARWRDNYFINLQSIPPTNLVKRSVLEKLINVALIDDEQKASCGPICSRIIEEAREELERTKS